MTDWERVEKLRSNGESWSDIAGDDKVGFKAPDGTDPGRAIKSLYLTRKSRGLGGRRPHRADRGESLKGQGEHPRRSLALGILAIVVVVGLITGYLVFYHPSPPSSNLVAYCGGEGNAAHYHVLLVIDVNGVQQHLPYDSSQSADIGFLASPAFTNPSVYCSNGGVHALHTHDGSGIIHAELPAAVTSSGVSPTLGDFFTIWGQNLSSTHVWIYPGHLHATMLDSDTGARTDFSSNPGSMPLYQSPQGPLANPYPIPQSLIFSGQYGNGASGSTFSGEIIWLNVTSTG